MEFGEGVRFAIENEGGGGGGFTQLDRTELCRERFGVLDEEAEVALASEVERGVDFRAEVVAEAHLRKRGGDAGLPDVMERKEFPIGIELIERGGHFPEFVEIRQVIRVAGNFRQRDRRVRLFELGRKREAGFSRGEGEGDKCRWDVEFVEGAGHGVLATDGGEAERVLRLIGS